MKSRLIRYKYLIGISFFVAFNNSKPMDFQQASVSPSLGSKAFQFAAIVGLGLGATVVSTFAHEGGHAIMAKILNGSPLDIEIGGYHNQRAIIKIGCLTIRGFDLSIVHARCGNIPSKINNILTYLAGPLTGATVAILLSKLNDNPIFKLICLNDAIDQIITNFNPGNSRIIFFKKEPLISYSDGAGILKTCIGHKKTEKIIITLKHPIAQCTFFIIHVATLIKMGALDLIIESLKELTK